VQDEGGGGRERGMKCSDKVLSHRREMERKEEESFDLQAY
jgi:hypothetical protein